MRTTKPMQACALFFCIARFFTTTAVLIPPDACSLEESRWADVIGSDILIFVTQPFFNIFICLSEKKIAHEIFVLSLSIIVLLSSEENFWTFAELHLNCLLPLVGLWKFHEQQKRKSKWKNSNLDRPSFAILVILLVLVSLFVRNATAAFDLTCSKLCPDSIELREYFHAFLKHLLYLFACK